MSYNQTAVRKMLDNAFSKSELNTLVFDHFGQLYEELPSKKSEFIMALVTYADRQGKMQAILDFTKRENRYQYDRFIGEIGGATNESSHVNPPNPNPIDPIGGSADLFISYSTKDIAFAQQINSSLRQHNFSTWLDKAGMRGGTEWPAQLTQAIKNCKAVVVIISPNSMNSIWVKRELEFADKEGKRVIPIKYGEVVLPDWYTFRFGNVQWIDFSIQSYEQNFNHLKEIL